MRYVMVQQIVAIVLIGVLSTNALAKSREQTHMLGREITGEINTTSSSYAFSCDFNDTNCIRFIVTIWQVFEKTSPEKAEEITRIPGLFLRLFTKFFASFRAQDVKN